MQSRVSLKKPGKVFPKRAAHPMRDTQLHKAPAIIWYGESYTYTALPPFSGENVST